MKISVLDHGHVEMIDYLGRDETVLKAARRNWQAPQRAPEEDKHLLRTIIGRGNTAPFSLVRFLFDVKLPRYFFELWCTGYRIVTVHEAEFYVPPLINAHLVQFLRAQTQQTAFTNRELHKNGEPVGYCQMVLPGCFYVSVHFTPTLPELINFARNAEGVEAAAYSKAFIDCVKPLVPLCLEAWNVA